MQKFIEKFAEIYTVVMVLAVMVGVIPPLLYDGDYIGWLYRALALLVVACPCATCYLYPDYSGQCYCTILLKMEC